MNTKKENLYMLIAFTGNAIFGFSFLFSKIALDIAEPLVLVAVRFTVAFALLNLIRFTGLVPCNFKGKKMAELIILGLLQPCLYFICESYGISMTSSSFAGIIIALAPIVGLVLGVVMLKEIPTVLQIIFSVLSVAGVLVMTTTGSAEGFNMLGFIILIGAVVSGSLYSVISRKLADTFTAFERTYVMFGVGTVVFIILALLRVRGDFALITVPLTTGKFWISILYLSCVSSVGAFMLLNKALDVLDVTRSLVFANVTTIISVIAGVIFLKEHFTSIQVIGIVMIVIGVYGVNRFTRKQ